MKDEYEENWQEFYQNNRVIPCHGSRATEEQPESFPFHLLLASFDGVPVSERLNKQNAEFQARLTFYDTSNKCMFGSTWIGPLLRPKTPDNISVSIPCNEPLYFHSSLNDYTITLIIEISVSDGKTYESCGWSLLRIFSNVLSLQDTEDERAPIQNRLQVFHGSPAALLLIQEPIEECPLLKKVDGCFITYTMQSHQALSEAFHLIPENVIISGDDIVPGISETNADTTLGVVNILHQPSLLERCHCYIDKVVAEFSPSVDAVETHLCQLLNQDRISKCELDPDGAVVSVIERKLLVGVHNGWCFISVPHVVYLEKDFDGQRPRIGSLDTSKSSPTRSQTRPSTQLVVKSRVDLDEIFQHPLCSLVFQLELLVSLPIVKPEFPAGKKAQTKLNSSLYGSMPLNQKETIALRWGAWSPFHPDTKNHNDVILNLENGPPHGANPFNVPIVTGRLGKDLSKTIKDDIKCQRLRFSFHSSKPLNNQSEIPVSAEEDSSMRINRKLFDDNRMTNDISDDNTNQISSRSNISSKPPLPGSRSDTQPPIHQLKDVSSHVRRARDEIAPLLEVPTNQSHTSIIADLPQESHQLSTATTRASQAKLHSAGYPPLTDKEGNPPFMIDPSDNFQYSLELEEEDILNCNEITFQFLALSWCLHARVFFTFQFYRFPQVTTDRLSLKDLITTSHEASTVPSILHPCGRNGELLAGQPGLEMTYLIDPSFMKFGERKSFLRYLLNQKLFIDVWDGDSLLLIGSSVVELKHLLRQGKSAVQVAHELDVISVVYNEENLAVAGEWAHQSGVIANNSQVSLEGKLFLRMGNVGSRHERNPNIQGYLPELKTTVVLPTNSLRNTDKTSSIMKPPKTVRAKLMTEKDSDLATVLFTRKSQTLTMDAATGKELDAVKQRKLKRMEEFRKQLGSTDIKSAYTLQKEEKVQRIRDLKTIQFYRNKCKHEGIVSVLEEAISTHHHVSTTLGMAEFFEYALTNPLPSEQTIAIHFEDKDLSVITSRDEWMYFKDLTNTRTPLEENMFHTTDSSIEIFLKGFETLHIPFRYQTFSISHSIEQRDVVSQHPLSNVSKKNPLLNKTNETTTKRIKVSFLSREHQPIAILKIDVDILPHGIDQTFRFYQAEQSFLKRTIRLPPWHTLTDSNLIGENLPTNITAQCSDDHVICEVQQTVSDEPQDVYIKCPCGASPSLRRVYILIYNDRFSTKPCLVWQILVASLQRIDLNMTIGQSSKVSVLLRGKQSSRMVQCYSSDPNLLQILPADQFMLMGNSVQEVQLITNPTIKSNTNIFVNVVDTEFRQLVKSWLICITCKLPVISKTFEVSLQVGGGKGSSKKIGFTNPYPVQKSFHLTSNRPDLLQFKEDTLLLGSGESHNVGLRFLPQSQSGIVNIFVFINDKDGKNEETFCIKALYKTN